MRRMLAVFALASMLGGCAQNNRTGSDGVAIYLTAQAMSGREIQEVALKKLELQPEPIIGSEDIVAYRPASHELVLTRAALNRLAALKVPVQGLGFVISVDGEPILPGAFWTPISSLSYEGLTIQVPLGASADRARLDSGYPGSVKPMLNDPRDDQRLLEAFRRAGKLQ